MTKDVSENLIKHFLLEKAIIEESLNNISHLEYQEQKYREYQLNPDIIDASEFYEWLQEKKQNNQIFREFLLQNDLLFRKNYITEITTDPSISCIKELPYFRKQIIISKPGEGHVHKGKIQLQSGTLVINGVYMNQHNYLLRISHDNTFIAGYVEGSSEKYNEYLWDYYNRLLATLHILRPLSENYPKVELISQGKVHVLTRKMAQEQLNKIAKRVHSYKYDDDYMTVSDR